MAVSCPIGFDVGRLRDEVGAMYARVAAEPGGEFHLHRGPAHAAWFLAHDAGELAALPEGATASFAGGGDPLRIDRLPEDPAPELLAERIAAADRVVG